MFGKERSVSGMYPSYQGLYEGVRASVRSSVGDTEYFSFEIVLHQGSTLSPFLGACYLLMILPLLMKLGVE